MAPKIVVAAHSKETGEIARELVPSGYELVVTTGRGADYRNLMEGAEYLLGYPDSSINDAFYKTAPRLRLHQLLSAGYDACDLEAARRAKVPVSNNGGANSIAVSEHAMLLMLAVSRRLPWMHGNVAGGRWRGNAGVPKLYELYGKTLGIVGLGSIGKKVARLGSAFGMRIQYYDILRLSEDQEDALGVKFRLLRELIRGADILSLHVPLTAASRHMIGAEELKLMKPTAFLVNTCRGPVVDEKALYQTLSSGAIAGAGLDVFDQEPPPADNPLLRLDNVVLSAHMAGPTWDNHVARYRNAFDNVQRVARGEQPLWVVPELVDLIR